MVFCVTIQLLMKRLDRKTLNINWITIEDCKSIKIKQCECDSYRFIDCYHIFSLFALACVHPFLASLIQIIL